MDLMGHIRMDHSVNIDCITITNKFWKVASNTDNVSKILIYYLCDNTLYHSRAKTWRVVIRGGWITGFLSLCYISPWIFLTGHINYYSICPHHLKAQAEPSLWNDIDELYVQVTVHLDKLRMKHPTRCIKYPKFILS